MATAWNHSRSLTFPWRILSGRRGGCYYCLPLLPPGVTRHPPQREKAGRGKWGKPGKAYGKKKLFANSGGDREEAPITLLYSFWKTWRESFLGGSILGSACAYLKLSEKGRLPLFFYVYVTRLFLFILHL